MRCGCCWSFSSSCSRSISWGGFPHLSMDTVIRIPYCLIVSVSLVAFKTSYGPVILNIRLDYAAFFYFSICVFASVGGRFKRSCHLCGTRLYIAPCCRRILSMRVVLMRNDYLSYWTFLLTSWGHWSKSGNSTGLITCPVVRLSKSHPRLVIVVRVWWPVLMASCLSYDAVGCRTSMILVERIYPSRPHVQTHSDGVPRGDCFVIAFSLSLVLAVVFVFWFPLR